MVQKPVEPLFDLSSLSLLYQKIGWSLYLPLLRYCKHLGFTLKQVCSLIQTDEEDLVEEDYLEVVENDGRKFEMELMKKFPQQYKELLPEIKKERKKLPFQEKIESLGPRVSVDVYNEKYIRPYSSEIPIQVIQSNMGTGKTTQMINFFREKRPKKNVFLTSRESLSWDIYGNLMKLQDENGEPLYQILHYKTIDEVDLKKLDSFILIIQLESLGKLLDTGFPTFDSVFLDEATSLMKQWSSGKTMKECFRDSREVFDTMVRYSPYLFVMDAFLDGRIVKMIEGLRGPNEKIHVQINLRGKEEMMAIEFENKYSTMASLLSDLRNGMNLFVTCSCKNDVVLLEKKIQAELPEVSVLSITSENSQDGKVKEMLKDVNRFFVQFRCVIISPTVTVGVNFSEEHFHRIYSFVSGNSCSMRDMLQMQGRIRNVSEGQILFCVQKQNGQRYTDPEIIKSLITMKIIHNEKEIDKKLGKIDELQATLFKQSFKLERQEDGSFIRVPNFGDWFFDVHCENKAEENRTHNNPYDEYLQLMKDQGYSIEEIRNFLGKENEWIIQEFEDQGKIIQEDMKEHRKLLKEEKIEEIASIERMTEEEFQEKKDKAFLSGDQELINKVKMHNLSSKFSFVEYDEDGNQIPGPGRLPPELYEMAEKELPKIRCCVLEEIIQTEEDMVQLAKMERIANQKGNPFNPNNRLAQLTAIRGLLDFLGHEGEAIHLKNFNLSRFDWSEEDRRYGEEVMENCRKAFGIYKSKYAQEKAVAIDTIKKSLSAWMACEVRSTKQKVSNQVIVGGRKVQRQDTVYHIRLKKGFQELVEAYRKEDLKEKIQGRASWYDSTVGLAELFR